MARILVEEQRIKGNKREVPPDLPIGVWWNKIEEYMDALGALDHVTFYDPVMELLPPERLRRLKAQVRVWFEVTGRYPDGEYPNSIECWWPIRWARCEGQIPWPAEVVVPRIDDKNVLHCGRCGARWSYPHADRCKLCGVGFVEGTGGFYVWPS